MGRNNKNKKKNNNNNNNNNNNKKNKVNETITTAPTAPTAPTATTTLDKPARVSALLPCRSMDVNESDSEQSHQSHQIHGSDDNSDTEHDNNGNTVTNYEEAEDTFNMQIQAIDEVMHNYLTYRDHDAHVSVNITEAILSIKESLNHLNSTMAHIATNLSKLVQRMPATSSVSNA